VLAISLRDCQYAIDAGDAIFAPRMKWLLLRACAIGKRRDRLKDSTLRQCKYDLERRLDAGMVLARTNRHGVRLRRRYAKVRGHLFTFLTERDVPYTNNGSERDIRPSATFRKVTGGLSFRLGSGFLRRRALGPEHRTAQGYAAAHGDPQHSRKSGFLLPSRAVTGRLMNVLLRGRSKPDRSRVTYGGHIICY
jgi:transposase